MLHWEKKDTFEEIQICRLLLRVFELGHILVRLVNAENRDEKSVNEKKRETEKNMNITKMQRWSIFDGKKMSKHMEYV